MLRSFCNEAQRRPRFRFGDAQPASGCYSALQWLLGALFWAAEARTFRGLQSPNNLCLNQVKSNQNLANAWAGLSLLLEMRSGFFFLLVRPACTSMSLTRWNRASHIKIMHKRHLVTSEAYFLGKYDISAVFSEIASFMRHCCFLLNLHFLLFLYTTNLSYNHLLRV